MSNCNATAVTAENMNRARATLGVSRDRDAFVHFARKAGLSTSRAQKDAKAYRVALNGRHLPEYAGKAPDYLTDGLIELLGAHILRPILQAKDTRQSAQFFGKARPSREVASAAA